MKQKDIIELTDKQLKETLSEDKLAYTRLRLSHSISSHDNPMKLKETKKKIARLLTEQRARAIKKTAGEAENK